MKKLFTVLLLCGVVFIACLEKDTVAPLVERTVPADGTINVGVNTKI